LLLKEALEETQRELVEPKLAVSHEVKRLCVLNFPEFESISGRVSVDEMIYSP